MKTMLAVLFLVFVCSIAHAQTGTATVSWVAPTTYTDNTPIPAGDLTGYVVTWSKCGGTSPNYTMTAATGTASVAAPALSFTDTTLDTTWTVPHCFTVAAVSKAKGNSAASAVVYKQIVAPPPAVFPKSPTGVAAK